MKVSISKISHHPINTNIYNVSNIEELSKSIDEVGLLQKIVVNSKFQIISGSRRFEALKLLNWEEVEVDVNDIDDKDTILYLISYNRQRVKTSTELLNEIKFLYDYYGNNQGKRTDLTSNNVDRSSTQSKISMEIGISNGNISKLLFIDKTNNDFIGLIDKGIMTINQGFLECKRIEKQKLSIKTNNNKPLKSISQTDRIKIYNSSSDNMKEIEDETIQTIITSPPYWNKRVYSENQKEIGSEKEPGEYINNLVVHLTDCYRVLKKEGSFFLNLGDTFLNGCLQNIPHRVVIKLTEKGWILRNTIIWKKSNPKPSSSKTNLTSSYEFIFHLVKSKDYLYNQLKIPLSSKTKPSHPPRHRNLKNNSINKYSPYIPSSLGKNIEDYIDGDVIKTAVANQSILKKYGIDIEHPAPFNSDIVILPILQTSNEGDIVLDPFSGIGSVCDVIQNLKLGRKYVGYEINENFVEVQLNRFENINMTK